MTNFSAGLNRLTIQDQSDVSFSNGIQKLLPNVGAGIYFQAEKFYAGVSVPKILQNNFYTSTDSKTVDISKEQRHYYFIMGGIIPINPQLKFKPTILAKLTESAPAQADLTANFIINDIVTLGAMYRTGDAFGALAGVNLTEQFSVGYSFDWSTTSTGK